MFRHNLLSNLCAAAASFTLLMFVLIVLMRTLFPAQAGEIAFESNQDGNWEIYLLDLQTGITHNLTRSPADDFAPSWSPDGSSIVFTSDRDRDTQPELYIMSADGSHLRFISGGGGEYRDPMWSKDGRSMTFTHGFGQMFVRNVETGKEQWLGYGFTPSLSPDATHILYAADRRGSLNANVYTTDLQTRRVHSLTPEATHNWSPVWSPDGQQIAFVSSRSGRAGIYVMNADGSAVRLVTSANNDLTPEWTADGQHLIFASGFREPMQLYMIPLAGGAPRALTALPGDSHAPAWRPAPS